MNIAELKALIKDMPDETPFMVCHDGNMDFGSYQVEPEIAELYVFDFDFKGAPIEKIFYDPCPRDAKIKRSFKALIMKTYD